MTWHPIETCPEGVSVLIYGGELESELGSGDPVDEPVKARKRGELCFVVDTCYYGVWVKGATHWTPLPTPPAMTDEKQK